MRLPLLALTILSLTCIKSYADSTLTLVLPPSQAAKDLAAQRDHVSQTPISRTNVSPRGKGSLAYRGGKRNRVVGKLGLLNADTAIFRASTMTGKSLTVAPAGTYLAIQNQVRDRIGVLMSDGTTGWLEAAAVKIMDTPVVTDTPSYTPNFAATYDNFPRSDTPFFTGDAQSLIAEAYKYLGVRYVWGGNTKNGIDCSGFVKNVFESQGFRLPRLGSDHMAYGIPVATDQLQAGDRLYFGRRTERLGVTHTGLYIGNGYFIHASSGLHSVSVSRLDSPTYSRIYVCARR